MAVTITAGAIVDGAFDLVGVKDAFEDLDGKSTQDGLRRLNALVDSWATQRLTMSATSRLVFPLISGRQTYTIGDDPAADLQTPRPTAINNAGLLLGNTSPPVEIPRAVISDDAYAAIGIKDLQNPLFTFVYYNATYPFGQITLWPVPNTAIHSLVLYVPNQLAEFPDLVTEFILPPGYAEALEYNLALRLAAPYARPVPPDVAQLAREALVNLKRLNVVPPELAVDPAMQASHRGLYNIVTDTGAG